jgi:opacity protein-like surface antigen
MFLPYVTVGAGIARDKSKGTLFDNAPLAATPAANLQTGPNQVSFKDLTKTTFAYQAGAGIATSFDNVVLGVGYKFFGLASFSDSNTDLTASVVSKTGTDVAPVIGTYALNNLNFGSMKKNTHNVTAFVKFAF